MAGGGVARRAGVIINGRSGRFSAMAGLTDQQQAYVRAFLANGGNGNAAAATAGYAFPSQAEWQLSRNSAIQTAIRDGIGTMALSVSIAGLGRLRKIIEDNEGRPAAQVAAARAAAEVAKLIGKSKQEDGVDYGKPLAEMSLKELTAFIAAEKQALAALEDITPAAEIEAIPPGLTPDAGVTDLEYEEA